MIDAMSNGLTYDQAADRHADLMDASEGIARAIESLESLADSPVGLDLLGDIKYDIDAEVRRMRDIMDDCRRQELLPERLGE